MIDRLALARANGAMQPVQERLQSVHKGHPILRRELNVLGLKVPEEAELLRYPSTC